ncbi:MAG TPA: hypothetical protein VGB77_15025 [Abditibacteriaceae bacterium]
MLLSAPQADAGPRLGPKLDLFLSNFSEALPGNFKRGKLRDENLTNFAIRHNSINSYKDKIEIVKEHNFNIQSQRDPRFYQYRIAARFIDGTALWYFNRKPARLSSAGGFLYANGYYYFNTGEGDPLPFAHVTKLRSLGNGEYHVTTREYASHDTSEYNPAQWRRRKIEVFDQGRASAIIKETGKGTQRRLILLEYQRFPK